MEAVWAQSGNNIPVKIVHEDTLKRVLSSGWQLVDDPTLAVVTTEPEPTPELVETEVSADGASNDGNADNANTPVDRRSRQRDTAV